MLRCARLFPRRVDCGRCPTKGAGVRVAGKKTLSGQPMDGFVLASSTTPASATGWSTTSRRASPRTATCKPS
eukprot:2741429-Alexandrium_andersonii.AAC.1